MIIGGKLMFLRATDMNGEYSPAFFTIKLDSSEVNYDMIDLIANPTFIHEYIHFMQYLILPYCIRMNLSYIRYFNDICQFGKKESKIEIPFKNWAEDTKELRKQLDYTFGSKRDKNENIGITSIDKSSYSFSGFDNHLKINRIDINVFKYEITFKNNSKYQLGARDLLEYIAHSIERKYYNPVNSCPDFPYKTVDILFDYYNYSEIETEKRVLIAEYCLHNDNPIRYLIYNVFGNKLLIDKILKNTVEELCEILPKNPNISSDLVPVDFYEKERRRLSEFLNQLQYIYDSDKLKKWIHIVNDYSKLNFQGTFVFTNLFTMPSISFKSTFAKMIEDIGTPFMINKNDKIITIDNHTSLNNRDLAYFFMVERFVHFAGHVNSSYKTCPVAKFCEQNYEKSCSKQYILNQNSPGCPYKSFLKTKGIDNIPFEKAQDSK